MSTSALLETLTLPEARRVLREISLLSDSLDKLVLESVSAVIAERQAAKAVPPPPPPPVAPEPPANPPDKPSVL